MIPLRSDDCVCAHNVVAVAGRCIGHGSAEVAACNQAHYSQRYPWISSCGGELRRALASEDHDLDCSRVGRADEAARVDVRGAAGGAALLQAIARVVLLQLAAAQPRGGGGLAGPRLLR